MRTGYHPLDKDALREALKVEIPELLAAFRRTFPEETLYGFLLYTNGEGQYAFPSLNTEEGLRRRSAHYINELGYPNEPELLAAELRWSPCDWAYHGWENDRYSTDSEIPIYLPNSTGSGAHLFRYEWIIPEDDGTNIPYQHNDNTEADCVYLACLEALSELNAEGAFGEGADREKLTVGLFMGDQSDEQRLRWAQMVNPPIVWKRLQAEMKAGLEVYEMIRQLRRTTTT